MPHLRSRIVPAALLLLLGAGCGQAPSVTIESAAADTESRSDDERKPPTISVSGDGKASGTPDLLQIDVGVSILRPTVSDAIAEATQRANDLRDAALKAGIAAKDVQTANYSISPEYDPQPKPATERKLLGHRVTYTLGLKLRDFARAGAALDAVTKAGGADVTVNGLRFAIENPEALQAQARELAWKKAAAKAEQLASLAGVHLGAPRAIAESGVRVPGPFFARAEMAGSGVAADVAPPIEPGQLDVTVNVSVEFAIDGPAPTTGTGSGDKASFH